MDRGMKRRKKQAMVEEAKTVKKRKLTVVEEAKDTAVPSELPVAVPKETPEKDPNVSRLRKDIYEWMEQQAEYERADLEALLEESNQSPERNEEVADLEHMTSIKALLRGFNETEIRKSYKYECEWRKCTFMSGNDRKYFLHVESHAELVIDSRSGSYACDWDLCDYVTEDDYEYMGHVHYHAYHTKLKVYGASVQMLAKLPSCTNDSRTRNNITNTPVTFRCEWANCNERFNMVMHFFYHARNHVYDQYPSGKKSAEDEVECLWSLCKEKFKRRYFSLLHLKRHTTEREIACFTCGTKFYDRMKLGLHLVRQIELSQRKHECPVCGRAYATKSLLQQHVPTHEKNHQCTFCPMKFVSKSTLSNHMIRRHLKDRNFNCSQCEYVGYTKSDLMRHAETHDKTKIFRCEEFGCNVAYRSECAMKKHFAWHYNIPPTMWGCHICSDKTYTNAYNLTKHLRFVHNVERTPGYLRFMYKADSDGVFRLSSYVEQKSQQSKVKEAPGPSTDTIVDDSQEVKADGRTNRKKKKSNVKAPEKSGEANKEELSHDATSYGPIKGKPKINAIKSIGVHEFLIELDMEPETEEKEQQLQQQQQPEPVQSKKGSKANANDTPKAAPKRNADGVQAKREREQVVKLEPPARDEPPMENAESTQQPKDVKDFTVMKRYLKPSKKSA